jgi:hypothetical protein
LTGAAHRWGKMSNSQFFQFWLAGPGWYGGTGPMVRVRATLPLPLLAALPRLGCQGRRDRLAAALDAGSRATTYHSPISHALAPGSYQPG